MRTNPHHDPKDVVKAPTPMVVPCRLADCIFYEGPVAGRDGKCFCSHPQKAAYMTERQCPLYNFNWQRRMKMGHDPGPR